MMIGGLLEATQNMQRDITEIRRDIKDSDSRAALSYEQSVSIAQQIALLRTRGLVIGDEAKASKYLKFIGYYRLSGYMLPFQSGGDGDQHHTFHAGTTFDQILDLSSFDRKLRLLFLDAIERIEIAIRAAVSTTMSLQHGPHWFLDSANFEAGFDHADFIRRAKNDIGHDERLSFPADWQERPIWR